MKKDKIIGIRISEEVYEDYIKLIHDTRESFSEFARKVLDKGFEEYKKSRNAKQDTTEDTDDIYAFNQVTLAKDAVCANCMKFLPKGTLATLGFRENNTKPAIFCIYCKPL